MSKLAIFANHTPFAAMMLPMPDGEGGESLLVVTRMSFDIDAEGSPQLSEEPAEIRMTDAFVGPPALGFPAADSDIVLHKPRVDVLIHNARAYAPRAQPVRELFVELHVGFPDGQSSAEAAHDSSQAQLIKSLQVRGDRIWTEAGPSDPIPFVEMPLGWSRAYGGTLAGTGVGGEAHSECDERNPFGVGWKGARSIDPDVQGELPNIEDIETLLSEYGGSGAPAGFGVVSRAWLPRRALAGTFDFTWRHDRWPLHPLDWDPGFNQSAPADQQLDSYGGNEPVRLLNLTPEGEWLFRLPRLDVPVQLLFKDRLERPPLRVDTVEIDPAQRRVSLTARVSIPIVRGTAPLREIVLGHVKPGWLRARLSEREYVDLRGEDGVDTRQPCYS